MKLRRAFPVPLTDSIEVLGLIFDRHLSLDTHHISLTTRAQIRQAILKKISSHRWGAEIGVLEITAESVIGSHLRYGNVITGSCMPPDLIRKVDIQVISVAARRTCGEAARCG